MSENKILQFVEDTNSSEFYPTPKALVEKMLQGVNLDMVKTILEPSAGKGDILRVLAIKESMSYRHSNNAFDVDCIEIDPNLRQILKYNFSGKREASLRNKIQEIKDLRKWNSDTRDYTPLTPEQKDELGSLESEAETILSNGIHIVHDDFLTYNPYKRYDLIIMNPPFSHGAEHLLKAIKIQERGGDIICLLNAETLKNPYTEVRKELIRQLDKYSANIEYALNAFAEGERKTAVEIAIIKLHIEALQEESDIYERFKRAENMEDINPEEINALEVTDYIKAIINQFNVEMKSGLELIRQYRAMMPYMQCSFEDGLYGKDPILRLTDSCDRGYESVSINNYLKAVRLKYWKALLANPKFTGKLTTKLQEEYSTMVNKLADYDFSEFNIKTLSAEMNVKIKSGIEDSIITMFDTLTEEHSWYPETKNNRHYYDGWATNKAHKIDKKVIIPCYGIFGSWSGKPEVYNAVSALQDIERILNYLDGGMTMDVDLHKNLETYFKQGITKNVPLKYFKATFYKKGTVHLVFNCPELIKRFNIYAAQNKAWLPPCYGKKKYTNMTPEEKTVIDSFQGEADYNKTLEKAAYYFAPVAKQSLMQLNAAT